MILWCHGNAGNIINRLENLRELYRIGLSVFIFDYRGYGRSQGRPSEEGLYQDALGAHDYLTRTRMIRPERIVLFGRSLGAAVAGELAAQKPAAGLILESSFPSIGAVAKFHYGGLPVHWLLGADFALIDRLPQLSLPKLIIHGDKDDIIPLELGRQVFEAAKPPKSFYVIRRRRPQQHLPGRGRSLFPTMGRVYSGGSPIIGRPPEARRAGDARKARRGQVEFSSRLAHLARPACLARHSTIA